MSTLNDVEILITFEELKQLEIKDISACVDKYNALSICEKSLASPSETYNLWVQKLLKAYDLQEFCSNDWHKIIEYLSNVFNNFVQNLNPPNDSAQKELNVWWLDTQELLKWLESIVISIDVGVLSLILTLALEIITKTYKFAEKGNLKPILAIQKLVIFMVNSFMFEMPINDADAFEGSNKVLSSLCDVGTLISEMNIKTSIETWRTVAKLGDKCKNCLENLPDIHTENVKCNWHEKAIFGIIKELSKILKSFVDENCGLNNNNNVLQVAQFYLKLLKIIIHQSSNDIHKFSVIKEFFDLYTLCYHHYKNKKSEIDEFINKDLYELFSFINQQPAIKEHILKHLKNDVDNFNSCNLILNYLQLHIDECRKAPHNDRLDVCELLAVYDLLFEGPLMFIDGDKYPNVLEYYAAFTIQDSTNELHKKLCHYVVSSSWIKAYVSSEILRVYYSYLSKNQSAEEYLPCLEFWLKIWNKLNHSNAKHKEKRLTEFILKTILHNIPDYMLQRYCTNFQNLEIVMLLCGKEHTQLLQYFQTSLIKNLRKMQQYQISKVMYIELINLLEVCQLRPQWLNISLKENLLKTFLAVFSIPPKEVHRFREFINKCFGIFINLNDKKLNSNVLQCLMNNLQHVENIGSVYLIEFLLKQKPQSLNLLQVLKSSELTKITNLIDYKSLANYKNPIDLKVFKNLPITTNLSNSNNNNDIQQISKKPRLGECNLSNIKFILNEMNLNTQQLLNFDSENFDTKDYELLNCIKNNIEKCLTK